MFPLHPAPSQLAGSIRKSCWLARPAGVEFGRQVRSQDYSSKNPQKTKMKAYWALLSRFTLIFCMLNPYLGFSGQSKLGSG